jgi:hypothetical protein
MLRTTNQKLRRKKALLSSRAGNGNDSDGTRQDAASKMPAVSTESFVVTPSEFNGRVFQVCSSCTRLAVHNMSRPRPQSRHCTRLSCVVRQFCTVRTTRRSSALYWACVNCSFAGTYIECTHIMHVGWGPRSTSMMHGSLLHANAVMLTSCCRNRMSQELSSIVVADHANVFGTVATPPTVHLSASFHGYLVVPSCVIGMYKRFTTPPPGRSKSA